MMMTFSLRPQQQSGFVLITSLIILLAMTLLGIALVRSIDTATLVSNNLGFRQSALASADRGTEAAATWINANKAALTADSPNAGYYATEQAGTDFTGQTTASTADDVDWTGAGGNRRAFVIAGTDTAGNSSAYIIQRMCNQSGAFSPSGGIQCATTSSSVTSGGSKGGVQYGSYAISGKAMIHYRITTRTRGPKNTTSYIQTTVLVEY
jgi:Tfp pilus assembly protein PilX